MERDAFLLLLWFVVLALALWVWSLSGELADVSSRASYVEDQVWRLQHGDKW